MSDDETPWGEAEHPERGPSAWNVLAWDLNAYMQRGDGRWDAGLPGAMPSHGDVLPAAALTESDGAPVEFSIVAALPNPCYRFRAIGPDGEPTLLVYDPESRHFWVMPFGDGGGDDENE